MTLPNDLYRVADDGSMELHFHAGQWRAWDSEHRFIAVLAGTQSGKCVIIGTMITMADGSLKRIEEINPGEMVLSLGGDLKIHPNVVSASFSTGTQAVYKITTDSGRTVIVTGVHPLLGVSGWEAAETMQVGSWIGVPRIYPDLSTKQADDKEMRLLGYLLGDGGLTNSSPMFSNEDVPILEDLHACLPEGVNLIHAAKYDYRLTVSGNRGAHREKDTGQFSNGTNPVIELCRKWGIWGHLAKEKRIPAFVYTLDKRSIAMMLKALFDCDGTVDAKGIEIVLASEGLIDDIQHLLLRFGIVGRKRYKAVNAKNGKIYHAWRLFFSDMDALTIWMNEISFTGPKAERLRTLVASKQTYRPNGKDLIPNFPLAGCVAKVGKNAYKQPHADQAGYALLRGARRENVARSYAQKLSQHFEIGQDLAYSHIYWDKVRLIEPLGEQATWDLTVAEGHNYIAEDVFCHNTSFGPHWLYREICWRGAGDYMVVTPTYPLLDKKALPEFRHIFEHILNLGSYVGGSRNMFTFSKSGELRTFGARQKRPTTVMFGHAQDPESLESATAKAAWLDEAGQKKFKLGSWEAILRRLSVHMGRALITTTPYNLGWLKQKLWDPWVAANKDHAEIDVVHFRSIDNPAFPEDEYDRARRDLPLWKFNMFYNALFTRPAGLIYDCLDETKNIIPRFTIPDHWQRYLGLDFGGVNTAGIFYAQDPQSKHLYAYREYKAGSRSAAEHVYHLLDGEPMIPICVGGSNSEGQWRREFRQGGEVNGKKQGLPVKPPAVNDVEVGIDRVYGANKRGEISYFDDLEHFLEEKRTYSRELDEAGEPTEKIEDKSSFHFCDAERYLVGWLKRSDSGPRQPASISMRTY